MKKENRHVELFCVLTVGQWRHLFREKVKPAHWLVFALQMDILLLRNRMSGNLRKNFFCLHYVPPAFFIAPQKIFCGKIIETDGHIKIHGRFIYPFQLYLLLGFIAVIALIPLLSAFTYDTFDSDMLFRVALSFLIFGFFLFLALLIPYLQNKKLKTEEKIIEFMKENLQCYEKGEFIL